MPGGSSALAAPPSLAALLGAGVLYDLVERGRSFGPTQGYQAYLTTKVDIGPLVGDLTLVFTVLAIGAVALAARTGTRDPAAPRCSACSRRP